MLANQAQAATNLQLLASASCANTAAATGGWTAISAYEGDLMVVANIGAVTGSITCKLQDATDGSGTGAADVTPVKQGFTTNSTGAAVEVSVYSLNGLRSHARVVGTIVTGPVVVGVSAHAHPKNVA